MYEGVSAVYRHEENNGKPGKNDANTLGTILNHMRYAGQR